MVFDEEAPNFIKNQPKIPVQRSLLFSNDKIKQLTKLKLHEHIESFFNSMGTNRGLLQTISPSSINYNTDKSFSQATDPTQKRLQIARYTTELKSILPCILVVDGGIENVNSNIGLMSDAQIYKGNWYGYLPIFKKIPISIIVAAREVEEADEMSSVVSLLFNELRNISGGSRITGANQDETWAITLPNSGVNVSSLTDMDVPGDPVEKIWHAEATLEVFYEDMIVVKQPLPQTTYKEGSVKIPIINISSQIPFGVSSYVPISNLQSGFKVVTSDYTIATISQDLMITPRRRGKFKIRVIDPRKQTRPSETGIVTEKEVEIT